MHLGSWAAILAAFWLLLSGFFQSLLLFFGLVSVGLVLWVIARMDKVDQECESLVLRPSMLAYIAWLLKEIVKSSVDVTKLVWRGRGELKPAIAQIPLKAKSDAGKVLYANSITLTPGTLSVDLDDNSVTVHALQASSLSDLEQGEMEVRVLKASGLGAALTGKGAAGTGSKGTDS